MYIEKLMKTDGRKEKIIMNVTELIFEKKFKASILASRRETDQWTGIFTIISDVYLHCQLGQRQFTKRFIHKDGHMW